MGSGVTFNQIFQQNGLDFISRLDETCSKVLRAAIVGFSAIYETYIIIIIIIIVHSLRLVDYDIIIIIITIYSFKISKL